MVNHYPNIRLSERIILNFVWGWILNHSKVSYEKLGVFFLFLLWNILPQPQTLVNVCRDLVSRVSKKKKVEKNKLKGLHSFSRISSLGLFSFYICQFYHNFVVVCKSLVWAFCLDLGRLSSPGFLLPYWLAQRKWCHSSIT